MGIIHVLDEQLTNMIAAGEVVDRPVNIVKECVENALDAGATSIDIEVYQGGIDGVTVTDNGCGMSFEDARMAFERHATSKIQSEEELFSISTMGFRGEALPSIASVSRVHLTTADGDDGTSIVWEYGELKQHEHASVPQGTRIEVTGLFLHTPARFKYLKKPNYEFAVIADAVNKIALAHPEVRITLRHDQRMVFQTSGKSNRLEILYQMFGRDAASKAEEFEAQTADFRISGYAMQPSVNRASKNYIYLVLNGRTIRSWPIVNAVVDGYREYMPRERYPICFLNIETDFQLVDVNVHPNKLEVRISKEEYLADLIKRTISALFEENILAPSISEPAPAKKVQKSFSMEPMEETMVVRDPGQASSFGSSGSSSSTSASSSFSSSSSASSCLSPSSLYKGETEESERQIRSDSENIGKSDFRSDLKKQPVSYPAGTSRSDSTPIAANIPDPDFLNPSLIRKAQKGLADLKKAAGPEPSDLQNASAQPSSASIQPRSEAAPDQTSELSRSKQRSESGLNAPAYPAGTGGAKRTEEESRRGIDYLKTLRVIGQLKNSYILCEDENGLVIIDQHAAQERANFERILDSFQQEHPIMQPLMIPISRPAGEGLLGMLDQLNRAVDPYGLHFEALASSLVLREIPAWMIQLDAERFVDDLLSWFVSHSTANVEELRRHMVATAACHSSIRFNRPLSHHEMEKVIEDLVHCRQPYHCPHGRPTIIRIGMKQLAREFERA